MAKKTASPRELEADLLLQAAARLQAIKDSWDKKKSDLNDALLYNRKLWTVFLSSVTGDSNQLPSEIRQNVATLGVFVMKQTMAMMTDPQPNALSSLISINRELAAGLRGRA
jgi:flagellar protein FlaF